MNANAPTFVPTTGDTPPLLETTGQNNSKKGAKHKNTKQAEAHTQHPEQQQRHRSNKKRFQTPPIDAAGSSNHPPSKFHPENNTNNPTAVKNKGNRRLPPKPAHSYSVTESSDMLEISHNHQPGTADRKGRVSLNHLLSFSFPARQQQPVYAPRRHKPSSYQPYNKERFVNANFRFVVKPSASYLNNLIEPDSSFDWENIEQVLLTGEEALSCPICLSPPTAARVTKCGHTFCLSCILHYLELREPKKQWRKCPICWESVYAHDLKSVRIVHPFAVSRSSSGTAEVSSTPSSSSSVTTAKTIATTNQNADSMSVKEGDTVEFCLMFRSSKSTLALPLSDTWPISDHYYHSKKQHDDPLSLTLMPWHFTPDVLLFGRFMLASPDYLLMENDRDIRELKMSLTEAKEWSLMEEIPFIEAGMRQLTLEAESIGRMYSNKSLQVAVKSAEELLDTIKMDRLQERRNNGTTASSSLPGSSSSAAKPARKKLTVVNDDDIPEAYRQHHLQRAGTDDMSNTNGLESSSSSIPHQQQHTPQQHLGKQQQSPPTEYKFFQAKDGQHIYLHPLDIRMLKHEYGDYQYFPATLNAKATGVEETTLTEEVRKRFRYLGHLPLACDVTFIEVDMKPLVSKDTMDHFQHELKLRYKKRQDRIKREEKERKAAARKQQKKQVENVRREEQIRIDDDPFFRTYQPMSQEENDAMLQQALETSAMEAQQYQDQPKTVWGTPAVSATNNETVDEQPQEWAEHIVITQGRKKNKGKRK